MKKISHLFKLGLFILLLGCSMGVLAKSYHMHVKADEKSMGAKGDDGSSVKMSAKGGQPKKLSLNFKNPDKTEGQVSFSFDNGKATIGSIAISRHEKNGKGSFTSKGDKVTVEGESMADANATIQAAKQEMADMLTELANSPDLAGTAYRDALLSAANTLVPPVAATGDGGNDAQKAAGKSANAFTVAGVASETNGITAGTTASSAASSAASSG